MIPWVQLDSARIPGGDGEFRLMRRGAEFSIMLGSNTLMSSRQSGSEKALATLTCEKLRGRPAPQLLIGGLGMGFTLRAALADLGPDAGVVVAELVPTVLAWARGPMAELFGGCLDDPRTKIHQGDVAQLIRSGRASYDAILLDVDNGPEAMSRGSNDSLYSLAGLSAAHTALRPGGVLAVWSQGPDRDFTQRLRTSGFVPEEAKVRANVTSGTRHVIWLATKVVSAPEGQGARRGSKRQT